MIWSRHGNPYRRVSPDSTVFPWVSDDGLGGANPGYNLLFCLNFAVNRLFPFLHNLPENIEISAEGPQNTCRKFTCLLVMLCARGRWQGLIV